MQYSISIDQVKTIEWGLSVSQAMVFDYLTKVAVWAQEQQIDGNIYYHVRRKKLAKELPAISKSPETFKRHLISLEEKGLIERKIIGTKPFVRISEKGKKWNQSIHATTSAELHGQPVQNCTTTSAELHGQPVQNCTTTSAELHTDQYTNDQITKDQVTNHGDARRSALPTDSPNEFDRQKALRYWKKKNVKIDIEMQVDLFRSHHQSKGTKSLDWSASWRTWYTKAALYAANDGRGSTAKRSGIADILEYAR